MKPTFRVLFFLALATLLSQTTSAASVKELLEEAFDSQTGNVFAPIDGQVTDIIRRTAPIRGNVMARVKTIKHFKEKDCRRFSIELQAEFAPESGYKGAIPLPKMELNYCKGGSFPQEGVDPEAGKKFMEQVDKYAQQRAQTAPLRQDQNSQVPSWVGGTSVGPVTSTVAPKNTGIKPEMERPTVGNPTKLTE